MNEWTSCLEDYNLLFEYQFGYCTKRFIELETTLFVDNVKKQIGNQGLLTGGCLSWPSQSLWNIESR